MIGLNKLTAFEVLSLAIATALAAGPATIFNSPVDITDDFHALENF